MKGIDEYFAWLARTAPAVAADLCAGADPAALEALAQHVGFALPDALMRLYRLHDGQRHGARLGVIYGLEFLSLAELRAEWDEWAAVRNKSDPDDLDVGQEVFVPDLVQQAYTTPGWLPLFRCPGREDYFGADLNPESKGCVGQVINFGLDEPEKYVAARDLDEFFALLMSWVRVDVVGDSAVELRDHVEDLFSHGGRVFERLHARASGEHEDEDEDDEQEDDDPEQYDEEPNEVAPPPELRASYETLLDKVLQHLREYGRSARAARLEVERKGDTTHGGLQIYTGGNWQFGGQHEIQVLCDALLSAATAHGYCPRIVLHLWREDDRWRHTLKALG